MTRGQSLIVNSSIRAPLTPLNLFPHYRGRFERPTNYAPVVSRLDCYVVDGQTRDCTLQVFSPRNSPLHRSRYQVHAGKEACATITRTTELLARQSSDVSSASRASSFSRSSRLIMLAIIENCPQSLTRGGLLSGHGR